MSAYIAQSSAPHQPQDASACINTDFVLPQYCRPSHSSSLWTAYTYQDSYTWHGSVFGNIGRVPSHNALTEPASTSFWGACATTDQLILSVTHNQGKIGTMEDGFLFYYMLIAAHQSFVLQATATILQLNPQIEQVAFGLMVRDELLIDTACQYPLGDYVATGYLHTPVCAFGRKNTKFISGAPSTHVVNQIGDSVSLTITATQEGYSLQYGDNPVQSAGFDYALTRIDHDYVYAGMFVSRNATVAFSNVHTQFI